MAETEWSWAWEWWQTLVIINVINVIICLFIFVKSYNSKDVANKKYLKRMRVMGLIYCLVALYRVIFVSRYLTQLAWFDTIFNSSLLIRGFAVFAEVSFAGLIASALLQFNKEIPEFLNVKDRKLVRFLKTRTPYIFFALLFIAQFFATSGLITKLRVLFAIEETLWGLAFLAITPLVIMQLKLVFSYKDRKPFKLYRIFTVVMTIFCVGYCIYSLGYHLPIEYWPEAIAQLQMKHPEPAFRFGMEAISHAFFDVNVTRDLSAWGGIGFIIWHTGYFTLCVWMVLVFMSGPRRLGR